MPIYLGGWSSYNYRVETDRLRAKEVVSIGAKLVEHPDMSSNDIHRIQEGVRSCQDFLRRPFQFTTESYNKMSKFLESFVKQRALWCHEDLRNVAASAVPAVYELSKIDKSLLPENLRSSMERLVDYSDFFEEVTKLLSCTLCFGDMYHNQIDPRTKLRFKWADIANDLKLYQKYQDGSYYLSGHPDFEVISNVAQSIHEAAQAMGATKGSVEWQIIQYVVYQEHPLGSKRYLRTGNWPEFSKELCASRRTLEALWRGPFAVYCLQRNAARTMVFILRLIEKYWFTNLSQEGNGQPRFVLTDRAAELSRQIADTGSWYLPPDRRSVPMCNLSHILDEAFCSGLTIRDNSLTWDYSKFILTYEGENLHPLNNETWPEELDNYGLVSFLKIEPERVKAVMKMWKTVEALNSRLDVVPPLERLVLDQVKLDLEYTIISALRAPSLYTNMFLEKAHQVAGLDHADALELGFGALPQRGLICITSYDGISTPGEDLIESRKSQVTTIVNHIKAGRLMGDVDFLMPTSFVEHCIILSENPSAVILLTAMEGRAENAIKAANDQLDVVTEIRARRAWIDLNLALRHVLNQEGPIEYDQALCEQIVKHVGKTADELRPFRFVRHPSYGLVRRGYLPGF